MVFTHITTMVEYDTMFNALTNLHVYMQVVIDIIELPWRFILGCFKQQGYRLYPLEGAILGTRHCFLLPAKRELSEMHSQNCPLPNVGGVFLGIEADEQVF